MTPPSWINGTPRKILLATDLSARSDRALDRAAALALQWQSELVVLHVLEDFDSDARETARLPSWRRPPNPVNVAWKRLHLDVSAVANKAKVLISKGAPVEVIVQTVEVEACDLVVIGVARDELLGRFSLGRTVDGLLRRVKAPLLVVKERPRTDYHNIVVSTDFSDSSRHALEAAARFFPGMELTVFHAYNAPMSSRLPDPDMYRHNYRKYAVNDWDAFERTVDKPQTWQPPTVLLEHGQPAPLLRNYTRDKEVDLVVLGTRGRGVISEIFVGSAAKAIMDEVPCDTLIVRAHPAAVEPERNKQNAST